MTKKKKRGIQWYTWEDMFKKCTNSRHSEYTIRVSDRKVWKLIAAKLNCGDGTWLTDRLKSDTKSKHEKHKSQCVHYIKCLQKFESSQSLLTVSSLHEYANCHQCIQGHPEDLQPVVVNIAAPPLYKCLELGLGGALKGWWQSHIIFKSDHACWPLAASAQHTCIKVNGFKEVQLFFTFMYISSHIDSY